MKVSFDCGVSGNLKVPDEQAFDNTGVLAVLESAKEVVASTDPALFVAARSSPGFCGGLGGGAFHLHPFLKVT
jgi:hypothetical protein